MSWRPSWWWFQGFPWWWIIGASLFGKREERTIGAAPFERTCLTQTWRGRVRTIKTTYKARRKTWKTRENR